MLLLKIELSEIKSFFYSNFSHFGEGTFPMFPHTGGPYAWACSDPQGVWSGSPVGVGSKRGSVNLPIVFSISIFRPPARGCLIFGPSRGCLPPDGRQGVSTPCAHVWVSKRTRALKIVEWLFLFLQPSPSN